MYFYLLQAAEKLKITAPELCKLEVADGIIPVIILLLMLFALKSYSYMLTMKWNVSRISPFLFNRNPSVVHMRIQVGPLSRSKLQSMKLWM